MTPKLRRRRAPLLLLLALLIMSTLIPAIVKASGDFSISVSPATLTIAQGSSATTTVVVDSIGNFSSPVSLSISGLPTGVIAGFGTNPVTPSLGGSASSPLIISVGSSVPVSTYSASVMGANATVPHSTSLTLKVTSSGPSPDFTITISPASLFIAQGGSSTVTVTITSVAGFASPVGLTATGIPAGISLTFGTNPVLPPSGSSSSSSISINVASSAATGNYPISITGNSGSLSHGTTITITVTQAAFQDFSIASSSSSISLTQGSSASITLTLASLNGFTSNVGLSLSWVDIMPTGVTFSFPTLVTLTPGSTVSVTLTASATGTASAGLYNLRATGTSGALRHQLTVVVQIIAAVRDFSVTVSPSSVSMIQGSQSSSTVTVQSTGSFSSPVALAATGAPIGVTVSFGTNPIAPAVGGSASSTITASTIGSVAPGIYFITITGASGSLSHTSSLAVIVTPAVIADFTISSSSSSVTVGQGSSSPITVRIQSLSGFSSAVTLSGSWLSSGPTGVSFTIVGPITPLPDATASSPLNIIAISSASLGNFTLRVLGVSGDLSHYVDIGVKITAPKCLIATATYGSELSPEVELLRGFRDNTLLKTKAGSSFMIAFNAWYYSFSPATAEFLNQNKEFRFFTGYALYPVIAILKIGAAVAGQFGFSSEVGVVTSGLFVSWILGAVYFALPMALVLRRNTRSKEMSERLVRLLAPVVLAAFCALVVLEFADAPLTAMIPITSGLVLGSFMLSPLLISRVILQISAPKWLRYHEQAHG